MNVMAKYLLVPASLETLAEQFVTQTNIVYTKSIEYAYLEGQEGVTLESRVGFDVDGIELKARLDFAAKAIDWRGFWKNAGA